MDPTCRICLSAKRSAPRHIFQFGPDGHSPFRCTGSILGLFPSLRQGERGEGQRGVGVPFYATHDQRNPCCAAGTISGLARINEKAPTDTWVVLCQSNPIIGSSAFADARPKGGQNPELGNFSLFPVCVSPIPHLFWAPLCGDSPLVQARTSLSHFVLLRFPGGDVANPSPGVNGKKKKKQDQSACPIDKTLFCGVKYRLRDGGMDRNPLNTPRWKRRDRP